MGITKGLTHNFHYSEAEQIWGCVKVGSQFGVWGQMGIGIHFGGLLKSKWIA